MKTIILTLLIICNLTAVTKAEIKNFADRVSDYYEIDRELVRAIIQVESQYKITAKSKKDAFGVMQVTKPCYNDYLRCNPNTPYTNFEMVKYNYKANISVGVWYLKRICYAQTRRWKPAITAYFWGPWHESPTLVYYNKVKKELYRIG